MSWFSSTSKPELESSVFHVNERLTKELKDLKVSMERVSETNKLVVASMEEKIEAKDKEIDELKFLLSKSLKETRGEKKLREELLGKIKGMCAMHARLAGEFASEVQKEAEIIRMYSSEEKTEECVVEPGAEEKVIEEEKEVEENKGEETLDNTFNQVEESAEGDEHERIEKKETLAEIENAVEEIVNAYIEPEHVEENNAKEATKNDSEQLYNVVQREMTANVAKEDTSENEEVKAIENEAEANCEHVVNECDAKSKINEEVKEIAAKDVVVEMKEKQKCAELPTVIRDFSGNKILGMDDHELSECFNNIMKEENF